MNSTHYEIYPPGAYSIGTEWWQRVSNVDNGSWVKDSYVWSCIDMWGWVTCPSGQVKFKVQQILDYRKCGSLGHYGVDGYCEHWVSDWQTQYQIWTYRDLQWWPGPTVWMPGYYSM